MSNGEVCCILGICCPPEERRQQLADALSKEGIETSTAEMVAGWFDDRFDFAPKGMLSPLVEWISENARAHPNPNLR